MYLYRKYGFNHYLLDSEVIDVVSAKTETLPRSVSPTTNTTNIAANCTTAVYRLNLINDILLPLLPPFPPPTTRS